MVFNNIFKKLIKIRIIGNVLISDILINVLKAYSFIKCFRSVKIKYIETFQSDVHKTL